MLRYYTYYSVGGYKDLYLGNSEMNDDFTYYLPLLGLQKRRAESNGDLILIQKVRTLDSLSKINVVNKSSTYGFPELASRLVSHGGYKLIYTHLNDGHYVLTLRDIIGESKDASGHPVPFLIMIVADNYTDAQKLATIAAYWSNHMESVSYKVASMLVYDKDVNGIKFCLHQYNSFLDSCCNKQSFVETTSDRICVIAKSGLTEFILMPSSMHRPQIIGELGLINNQVRFIPLETVLPLDNPRKATIMKEMAKKDRISVIRRLLSFVGVGLLIIVAIVLWVFIRS